MSLKFRHRASSLPLVIAIFMLLW